MTSLSFLYKPLEQFEVNILIPIVFKIGDYFVDFSITNLSVFLLLGVLVFGLVWLILNQGKLIPFASQLVVESLFSFVKGSMEQQVGRKGQAYIPMVLTLFMFILVLNLLGMTPYAFAVTSQAVVNFTLSFAFFIAITIIGFLKQGAHYLMIFFPSGAPAALMPLLVVIEIVSYFIKAFSLAIRLFANIMSGHTLLAILTSFVFDLGRSKFYLGLFPLVVIILVSFLELAIAFLQAYVFFVLVLIYLKDAFELSH